ncbi:MAG: NAD(P)H-dependent oxidoreductase [Candidatus Saccharimonadales bacterium]
MITIKVIAGSTRPGRFNPQVAEWAQETASRFDDEVRIELVDLAEINLPLLDESVPASSGEYEHEHTKDWSKVIAEADGFIFVTPEYNHSISAALKNAIDYLYAEWSYKPATIISYGSAGGGTRAAEHLRGICAEIKIYDLREQLILANYWDRLDESGQYQFSEGEETALEAQLNSLIFWAKQMKTAREELAQIS